jgi:hypothetical protein
VTGTRCIVVVGTVSILPALIATLSRMSPDFLEEERLLAATPKELGDVVLGVPIAIIDESIADAPRVRAALANAAPSLTAIGLVKERVSDGASRLSSQGIAVVEHSGVRPLAEVFAALSRPEEELSPVRLSPGVSPMSAAIVHDLNNTVCVIGNYIEIMLEDPGLGEARRQDLLEIGRATEKAKTLVAALQASQRAAMADPQKKDGN